MRAPRNPDAIEAHDEARDRRHADVRRAPGFSGFAALRGLHGQRRSHRARRRQARRPGRQPATPLQDHDRSLRQRHQPSRLADLTPGDNAMTITLIADALVASLLVATIITCYVLSKRIERLKADEGAMRQTIGALVTATD